jgi:hypothetical protein
VLDLTAKPSIKDSRVQIQFCVHYPMRDRVYYMKELRDCVSNYRIACRVWRLSSEKRDFLRISRTLSSRNIVDSVIELEIDDRDKLLPKQTKRVLIDRRPRCYSCTKVGDITVHIGPHLEVDRSGKEECVPANHLKLIQFDKVKLVKDIMYTQPNCTVVSHITMIDRNYKEQLDNLGDYTASLKLAI